MYFSMPKMLPIFYDCYFGSLFPSGSISMGGEVREGPGDTDESPPPEEGGASNDGDPTIA